MEDKKLYSFRQHNTLINTTHKAPQHPKLRISIEKNMKLPGSFVSVETAKPALCAFIPVSGEIKLFRFQIADFRF
jgi:hypothetical protein